MPGLSLSNTPPGGYRYAAIGILTDSLGVVNSDFTAIARGADDARRHAQGLLGYIGGIGVIKP